MLGMQVHKVMTALPFTAVSDTPLDDAQKLMDNWSLRHLPVVELSSKGDVSLVGLVSQRDLLRITGQLPKGVRAMRRPLDVDGVQTLADLMDSGFIHTDLITAGPEEEIPEVARRLVGHHIGCVPVVEGDRLVGILTVADILRTFATLCSGRGLCEEVDPRLERLMSREPFWIRSSATLSNVQEAMARDEVHHLPVLSAARGRGELVGVVSDTDVRRAQGCGRQPDYPVAEFLTPQPAVASASTRASDAAALLVRDRIGSLPIVADPAGNWTLTGIVTKVDLLRHCAAVLGSPKLK